VAFRNVIGLGLSVLDEIYRVDEFSLVSPRIRYTDRKVAPGGMMSTAVAQAAILGCKTHLLTVVGDDREGRIIVRALRRHGVVTRDVVRDSLHPTTVAVVLVDRRTGERRFLVPDRRRVEAAAPDFNLARLKSDSLLLVDGHFPTQALRAARLARKRGATLVADFHSPRPACLKLLPDVEFPILPEEFGVSWGSGGPRETLVALREKYSSTPVITLGARGALALWKGKFVEIPARRVRVRDTTGAGDAFHGAFAAGLCHGYGVIQSLHLASRAAGQCCTALGGMGRLLTPEQMTPKPAGRIRAADRSSDRDPARPS
jgi:sulfofructose kinase